VIGRAGKSARRQSRHARRWLFVGSDTRHLKADDTGEVAMLTRFLNLLAEPNLLRRYVGRHRARG
jgi:hypothetical protein